MSSPTAITRYSARSVWDQKRRTNLSSWLTYHEQEELERLTHKERREQWLLARFVAKRMLASAACCKSLTQIELLTRDADNLGTVPRIRIDGTRCPWSLSIAHTVDGVLVGLSTKSEQRIGVDLAQDFLADTQFQKSWFTQNERNWLCQRPQDAPTIWALKEAFFKAANTGESWTPKRVEVRPSTTGRFDCTFFGRSLRTNRVQVERIGSQVSAAVCLPRGDREQARQQSGPLLFGDRQRSLQATATGMAGEK